MQAACRELEAARLDAFRIETGAYTGTQLDPANRSVQGQSRTTKRPKQSQTPRQPAATSNVVPLHFVSESEDRPPLLRDISQTSVENRGRQSSQATMPAAN